MDNKLQSSWLAPPPPHLEIEDLVAEGDTVAVCVTMTATHLGPFLGVESTARRMRYEGMDFFRFEEGKMVEPWTATDDLGLMQQLGVVSSSEPCTRPLPE
jgi:predicted ester cyclase